MHTDETAFDGLSRRDVMAAFAALAALASSGAAAAASTGAASVSLDDFVALSEKLTGYDGLKPEIAQVILDAIVKSGSQADLAALVGGGAETGDLANRIVGDWYSGVTKAGDADEVATYENALMWKALSSFTKPMGVCGGLTGYWAKAPGQQAG